MKKYNVFDEAIDDDIRDVYNEELAQTEALIEASNLISEAMNEQGLNQNDLAEKLGVTKGYVSRLLSGNENMTIKNVARVLDVLGKKYIQTVYNIERNDDVSNILNFKDYSGNSSGVSNVGKVETVIGQSGWNKAV